MIRLNVKNIYEASGFTKYYVCKMTGLSYTNFGKLINNKTKGISFDILEKLCEVFNCKIEDIIIRDK